MQLRASVTKLAEATRLWRTTPRSIDCSATSSRSKLRERRSKPGSLARRLERVGSNWRRETLQRFGRARPSGGKTQRQRSNAMADDLSGISEAIQKSGEAFAKAIAEVGKALQEAA